VGGAYLCGGCQILVNFAPCLSTYFFLVLFDLPWIRDFLSQPRSGGVCRLLAAGIITVRWSVSQRQMTALELSLGQTSHSAISSAAPGAWRCRLLDCSSFGRRRVF